MAARPRRKAPVTQQPQAKYDAAGSGRRIKSWSPPSSGPQRAVEGLQKIRDRARDTTRNDWAGESGVQKWTTNLVGVGVTPRWTDERYDKIWASWVPSADADGVLDAYGVQTLMVRSWLASGEVFLRRRSRDLNAPLPAPVQVQLIESDFVPIFDADTWTGMPVGHTIRQGVERNKYGRRTAYWMWREHPGDRSIGHSPSMGDLIRVAASDVSHIFEPVRPGQLRGVSSLAPILVKLRASMDFEDAVLDRQKLANLFTMFITRALPPEWADINRDPDTGLPKFYDDAGNALVGLEPGISQELRPGEDVKFANPPEAGTTYSDYMRTTHMGTAAGQGLPYELFSGDILNVSDRTLRIVVNEFRRFARQRQWQIVIPMGCKPMARWLGEAAVLSGQIRASELEAFAAPEWSPEGWEYIHPVQDIEGKLKARDGGLVSTSQLISERGDDPRKVLEQRKKDEESGLTPAPVAPAAPAAAPAAPAADPPQARAQADAWNAVTALAQIQASRPAADPQPGLTSADTVMASLVTMFAAQNDRMAATQDAMLAFVNRLADKPTEIHAHMPPGEPPVVHVAAPAAPIVNVAPPAVTVEAPTVNVAAPVVNVAAADVTVDVNLPVRQIESDITRDRAGNITNVVQTERTIQ
jgi:lambda family phage portal protein